MNDFKLLPDDPRLTAYALGELEGTDRVDVEKALQGDPAAQAVVDEIRRTAAQLEAAFGIEADEPLPALMPVSQDPYARKKMPALLRFPQIYYVVGTLAAACFAVLLALHTPVPSGSKRPVLAEAQPTITEVNLPTSVETKTDASGAAALPLPSANDRKEMDAPKAEPNFSDVAAGLLDQSKKAPAVGVTGAAKIDAFTVPNTPNVLATANIDLKTPENLARHRQPAAKDSSPRAQELQYAGGASGKLMGYPREEKVAAATQVLERSTARAASLASLDAKGGMASVYGATSSLAGSRLNEMPVDALAAQRFSKESAFNTETYDFRKESDFVSAAENPLSTFSIDVDTASYANVRRFIQNGQRPPIDAVRIEELLNYFPYRYDGPETKRDDGVSEKGEGAPFAASMETADAPWAPTHRLVRIGLKGREISASQRGAANLVFLLDVSGSMSRPNRLPLVKESLRLLVNRLREDDHVAIVTYAGTSGLALPSTPVSKARDILDAIDELTPGGSTNGAMGIQLAYDIAKANFVTGGINRVILCTDGDFNVGVTSPGELTRLITEKAKSGVFLTALGFGMGNFKDATLQRLADAGNGNYGYIDQRREAEKLLVEQVSGTLVTIAKDVKLQVEFNPAKVASYRLIGYEKRLLQKEDFNNDAVDAGEIGAGHTVTALYEIVPVGTELPAPAPAVDELKYRATPAPAPRAPESAYRRDEWDPKVAARAKLSSEMLTLKVRYKEPAGDVSKKLEFPLVDRGVRFAEASADFKFASAVAAFGMILRDSHYKGAATLADVATWAEAGASPDPGGYRAEFLSLVQQAKTLM